MQSPTSFTGLASSDRCPAGEGQGPGGVCRLYVYRQLVAPRKHRCIAGLLNCADSLNEPSSADVLRCIACGRENQGCHPLSKI